jgi:hypothetical protein
MSSTDADDWFAALGHEQRDVLLELRRTIKAIAPDVIEEIKWGRPCYTNAHGLFCYLHSTRRHATLGFQKGALLDDPERLLEGTGKDMRHVRFDGRRSPSHPAVISLIRQAASL